jgi:hypothetical protein
MPEGDFGCQKVTVRNQTKPNQKVSWLVGWLVVTSPLIKVISIYEHKRVRRVLVPEWTARSQNLHIIG